MTDFTANAIALETAMERLRQERETFNQKRRDSGRWFALRLTMGYTAVISLPLVGLAAGYIALNPGVYSPATVTAATAALFVDVIGLLASIQKVVLNEGSLSELAPVTAALPPPEYHTAVGD